MSELRFLWQAVWDRMSSGRPVSTVRLRGLTEPQRSALADLLGLDRLPPADFTVPLTKLGDVRAQVERIIGPLEDRAAAREAARLARQRFRDWITAHPVVRAEPVLKDWALTTRADEETMRAALNVLSALPSDGRQLSVFAADVCDDTHALDEGTRLSTVVVQALAALHDEPPDRRARWEQAGISCDALSTTVLTAGLRPPGTDPLSASLNLMSGAGQACVVTLAQLTSYPLKLGTVHVVENPSVLSTALQRFGAGCPPLVTTSGWPSSAAMMLLRQAAQVRYHGDFDGPGLRIAAHVLAHTNAVPWRMSTADYLAAVRPGRPKPGRVTDAPWDPDLADALRQNDLTVSEEHVIDTLMSDLTNL